MRFGAAQTLLGTDSNEEACSVLVDLLKKTGSEEIFGIGVILALSTSENLPSLMRLLKDEDTSTTRFRLASLLLAWTPNKEQVLPYLHGLLNAGTSEVQLEAAEGLLGSKYNSDAVSALSNLMNVESAEVRCKAALLLVDKNYGEEKLTQLVGTIKENYKHVKKYISNWLSLMVTSETGASRLVSLLTDQDQELRRFFAEAISEESSRGGWRCSPLINKLKMQLPELLDSIGPGNQIYEAAWLYAELVTRQS